MAPALSVCRQHHPAELVSLVPSARPDRGRCRRAYANATAIWRRSSAETKSFFEHACAGHYESSLAHSVAAYASCTTT